MLRPIAAHAGLFYSDKVSATDHYNRGADKHELHGQVDPIRRGLAQAPGESPDCGDHFIMKEVNGVTHPSDGDDPAIREETIDETTAKGSNVEEKDPSGEKPVGEDRRMEDDK